MDIKSLASNVAQRLGFADNVAATGVTGQLGGISVQHLSQAQAPERSSGIGNAIRTFFEQKLPQVFARGIGAVMALFTPPFDAARNGRLRDEINRNIDPDNLQGSMQDVVFKDLSEPDSNDPDFAYPKYTGSRRGETKLANIFALDINRGEPIRFEGKPLECLNYPRETNAANPTDLPRAFGFCMEMDEKGISRADAAVLSRVMNQSTLGLVLQELQGARHAPDGSDVYIQPSATDRSWNLRPLGDGFQIDFRGKAAISAAPTSTGDNLLMGSGSNTDLRFTINLQRGDDGQLTVTEVRNGSFRVNAFDEYGSRVS